MTEKEEKQPGRRSYPSIVWPVILITAGVLLLLSNLDVLSISLTNLLNLWPVLLILAGLEIIIGRRSVVGNLLVLGITIITVAGVVILLVAAPEVLGPTESISSQEIRVPLDGMERAELDLDFAGGELNISRLTDSAALIVGDLELSSNREPIWQIDRDANQATMRLGYDQGASLRSWDDNWDIRLSPKVALTLDIDAGAGEANIDLTGLNVRELNASTGAGRSTIRLPREGDIKAEISGGVGEVVVEIPDGMAARIWINRGLGGVNVSHRFIKSQEDNLYISDDWDSNENRVDLLVEIGVGQVTIQD